MAILATVATLAAIGAWWTIQSGAERRESLASAAMARSRVQQGISLSEAEQLLGDAWHHARCQHAGWSEHLFFYGSRDLHETGVVFLRAEGPPGNQVVTFVGGVENYRLSLYDDCSELDLSVTRGS